MVPRGNFVLLVLFGCALGALCKLLQPAPAAAGVELKAEQVVRLSGGMPVLILLEKDGARRLPLPLGRAEAAQVERSLKMGMAPSLVSQSIEALGGRILRASIDDLSGPSLRAHLILSSGSQRLSVEATLGEALSLALEAGAPIVADAAMFEAVAVSPAELEEPRGARSLRSAGAPTPVQGI
jgi:bifunctional DNase/RNase